MDHPTRNSNALLQFCACDVWDWVIHSGGPAKRPFDSPTHHGKTWPVAIMYACHMKLVSKITHAWWSMTVCPNKLAPIICSWADIHICHTALLFCLLLYVSRALPVEHCLAAAVDVFPGCYPHRKPTKFSWWPKGSAFIPEYAHTVISKSCYIHCSSYAVDHIRDGLLATPARLTNHDVYR